MSVFSLHQNFSATVLLPLILPCKNLAQAHGISISCHYSLCCTYIIVGNTHVRIHVSTRKYLCHIAILIIFWLGGHSPALGAISIS